MANAFDSANYPSREPAELVVGDRWAWKRTDLGVDYPPAQYQLEYHAVQEGTGPGEIEITATGSGQDFVVEHPSSLTAAYEPGTYRWQAVIVRLSDSERVTVDSGTWRLVANTDIGTDDPRTHVKRVLDAIEAVIEGRASKDHESYSIEGRSLSRTPITDLIRLRDRYRAEYQREMSAERLKRGLGIGGRVLVRF